MNVIKSIKLIYIFVFLLGLNWAAIGQSKFNAKYFEDFNGLQDSTIGGIVNLLGEPDQISIDKRDHFAFSYDGREIDNFVYTYTVKYNKFNIKIVCIIDIPKKQKKPNKAYLYKEKPNRINFYKSSLESFIIFHSI